jgi:PST family polysaccharide transporter
MEHDHRRAALMRSLGLLAIIVYPLAIGLGTVAQTLTQTLFKPFWLAMGPMLSILSALSIVRPVSYIFGAYLQAHERTREQMVLEILKVFALLCAIVLLAPQGVLWTCVGVGVTFFLHAMAAMGVIHWLERISLSGMLWRLTQPLLACVPMVGMVLGIRALWSWTSLGYHGGMALVVEIMMGGLTYLVGALLIARPIFKDFSSLLLGILKKDQPKDDVS